MCLHGGQICVLIFSLNVEDVPLEIYFFVSSDLACIRLNESLDFLLKKDIYIYILVALIKYMFENYLFSVAYLYNVWQQAKN